MRQHTNLRGCHCQGGGATSGRPADRAAQLTGGLKPNTRGSGPLPRKLFGVVGHGVAEREVEGSALEHRSARHGRQGGGGGCRVHGWCGDGALGRWRNRELQQTQCGGGTASALLRRARCAASATPEKHSCRSDRHAIGLGCSLARHIAGMQAGCDMAGFNSLPEDLAIKVLGRLSLNDR